MLSHKDAEEREPPCYRDWLLWWHAKLTSTQCDLPYVLSHVPVKGFSGACLTLMVWALLGYALQLVVIGNLKLLGLSFRQSICKHLQLHSCTVHASTLTQALKHVDTG